jgi:hypothetical protein
MVDHDRVGSGVGHQEDPMRARVLGRGRVEVQSVGFGARQAAICEKRVQALRHPVVKVAVALTSR